MRANPMTMILRVMLLDLEEVSVVHDVVDHILDVVGLFDSGGTSESNSAILAIHRIIRRPCAADLRRLFGGRNDSSSRMAAGIPRRRVRGNGRRRCGCCESWAPPSPSLVTSS